MIAEAIDAAFSGRIGGFDLDVGFAAPMRGITALFGPSGSGKTTVLRCLAGLQRLPGRLTVGGEVWQDESRFVPPHRRAVGYVFQEASLFPHLSVRRNLDYGRRRALAAGIPEAIRPDDAIALLGLDWLLDRAPASLSGGERQRVAIGRALLSQPRLLLMDEPLSALDSAAKAELLDSLEALHAGLSIPVVYVSHDLAEVERLADHLVLLDRGGILAAGALCDLLTDPGLPLSVTAGASAVLPVTVAAVEPDGLLRLSLGGEALLAAAPPRPPGTRLRVRIRADDVSLSPDRPSPTTILNLLPAQVESIHPVDDARVMLVLRTATGGAADAPRFLARITRRSLAAFGFAPGQRVVAQIKSVSLLAAREAAGMTNARATGYDLGR